MNSTQLDPRIIEARGDTASSNSIHVVVNDCGTIKRVASLGGGEDDRAAVWVNQTPGSWIERGTGFAFLPLYFPPDHPIHRLGPH